MFHVFKGVRFLVSMNFINIIVIGLATCRARQKSRLILRVKAFEALGGVGCSLGTVWGTKNFVPVSLYYLMAAANAADPKTERNRLGGSGRVGPSRAE